MDALSVAVGQHPHDGALPLYEVGVEVAQQPEVEQAQASVRAEDAIVGVGITGDDAVTPGEAREEPERDLTDAVALCVAEFSDLFPR